MKTQLILVLNPIGLVGGVTFWDQSQPTTLGNPEIFKEENSAPHLTPPPPLSPSP